MPQTRTDPAPNAGGPPARPAICTQLDSLARIAGKLFGAQVSVIRLQEPVSTVLGEESLFGDGGIDDAAFAAVMADPDGIVVGDTHGDARFFAGVPLIDDAGLAIGALCVADAAPRGEVTADAIGDLRAMAKAAAVTIELAEIAHCEDVLLAMGSQSPVLREPGKAVERFETLVDALPQLVWSASADGQGNYFSRQWCEFTGAPGSTAVGAGWQTFVHPDDVARAREGWDTAIGSGEAYAAEFRLRDRDGGYRWMLTRGLPVTDDGGAIARWICTCTDIEDRVRSGDLLEFMSRELSHRIKNLFAVVQGLISMALRKHDGMAQVSHALQLRMVALGRAHDLVRPRFADGANMRSQTTLHDLIRILTQPYVEDDADRLEISGDNTIVSEQAATPLALFFHEMAINSAVFGALGAPHGRLRIVLTVGDEVTIAWHESGGPAIAAPPVPAFGLGLTRLTVERQLGGKLVMDWLPGGLQATAVIPLRKLHSD